MPTNQITDSTKVPSRPSGKETFAEEVEERRRKLAAQAAERRQAARRYQAKYRDEPLIEKIQRLTRKHWMEFDAIRREVEAFLPLINPTPAQRRDYQEQIAQLVNQYRREAGWE